MSGVMVDLVAVILSGLRPHGGFGTSDAPPEDQTTWNANKDLQ